MTQREYECEFQALICERAAMASENMQREGHGESMAYNGDAYFELAKRFRALAKEPIE